MFGADFLLSIMTLVVGTYFGASYATQFKDYILLVDSFAVQLSIFNHELAYINSQKPAGQRMNCWNKFSLVRDYLIISALRFALIPGIELGLVGNFAQYDLITSLKAVKSDIGFSIGSFIVIVAFYGLLKNAFFSKLITIGCVCARYLRSAAIFEMHKTTLSTTDTVIQMVKLNTFNGGNALTAITVVDVLFRGSLAPLKIWMSTRTIFAAVPLVQIYYVSLWLATYEQFFIEMNRFGTTAGVSIPAQLGDGFKVITLVICFYGYLFADIPEKIITKLFK